MDLSSLSAPLADYPERHASSGEATAALWLSVPLTVVWGVLAGMLGKVDLYATLGWFSMGCIVLIALRHRKHLRALLRIDRRAIVLGLGVGILMTAVTYPAFALLRGVIPGLDRAVTELYIASDAHAFWTALAWTCVIMVAEELLWRGAWLLALTRFVGPFFAAALSVCTYGLAQGTSGSWLLPLVAVLCGTIWTMQRIATRSLLAPLLSHMIWTTTVVLTAPVNISWQ